MKYKLVPGEIISTKKGVPTNLSYITEAGYKGKAMRLVLTKCACGTKTTKSLASIIAGVSSSCGKKGCKTRTSPALRKSYTIGDKVTDSYFYAGEDLDKSTSNHRHILVKCSCGNTSSIRIDGVKRNVSCKACGHRKRVNTFYIKHEEALLKRLHGDYIRAAKKRNYSFDLSFDQFKLLILQNCYYCNASPSNVKKMNGRTLIYNGIDRLDNTKGYYSLNTVSCCGTCNMMKNAQSFQSFLKKVKQINQHLNLE